MTESAVTDFTAPVLQGVWIHDTDDPEGTIRQYLYSERGRKHARIVATTALSFAGRELPVFYRGENQTRDVGVTLQVPFGTNYADDMDALEALNLSDKQHVYRDGRGRLIFGNIAVTDTDVEVGSAVELQISASEFEEEIA